MNPVDKATCGDDRDRAVARRPLHEHCPGADKPTTFLVDKRGQELERLAYLDGGCSGGDAY
jgi:hypothetical protein